MAWELNGNSDATATSFLGPTNAQPLIVKTAPTAGATPLERLRVTSEGRVGVGVINPQAKLTVAGGGALINNVAIGTDGLSVNYPNEQETIGLANPGTSALLRLQSPNGLAFHTGAPGTAAADNLRMTITPSGEVGIGKAPAANYKLEVAGILNATDYHKNGSALVSSQWTDVSGGINYAGGNVAITGRATGGAGVWGISNGGIALRGSNTSEERGIGVYAEAKQGRMAGLFAGAVTVFGDLTVINGNKPFKIDHPLDPQNKYLLHNAVEAPERKNVYDGLARLDEDGAAWVELPEWFDALNGDFRYQLTAVGVAMPNLHVAEEVSENRFKIAGGEGGMKICWQVTGSRKDPWAAANPFEVEQEKPQEERGRFLEPSLYGAPEEQRVMIGAIPEAVEEEHRRLIDELRRQEEAPPEEST